MRKVTKVKKKIVSLQPQTMMGKKPSSIGKSSLTKWREAANIPV
jgi:hypothetical protein